VPSTAPPTRTLSEADSKTLLAAHGLPFAREVLVATPDEAAAAAASFGGPVVVKLNGDRIAHKTERGLVRLRLTDPEAVREAATELLGLAMAADGDVSLLVAEMVVGLRELIVGLQRDPQFGMTVLLGVGGVLAEALADVQIRLVPITDVDAHEMIEGLATQALLGPFRGDDAVDREDLVSVLVALSRAAEAHPDLVAADVNPLIVRATGRMVAVDALVEVAS
jgi:acetyl-CoA synthetase (ADP-forming)